MPLRLIACEDTF